MAKATHAAPLQQMQALHRVLLAWYSSARRDLPWRRTHDPYAIWLSEVMLQQTRVETVIPYYERFLMALPTLQTLAEAPLERVLGLWGGLGYYRRARMLHAAARQVVSDHGGLLPDTVGRLRAIPGIGPYTAGAIASIAFDERAPVVDGNVARVLSRIFAVDGNVRTGAGAKRIWNLAGALVEGLPRRAGPGTWNQALMELGATICVAEHPRCLLCPASELCEARARGLTEILPRRRAKKTPPTLRRVALVASAGEGARGGIVLARRRVDGVFGGLWEPPSVDASVLEESASPARVFSRMVGTRVSRIEPAGSIAHVLSHRRLEVAVLRGVLGTPCLEQRLDGNEDYDAFDIVPPAMIEARGLSSYGRKVLACAAAAGAGAGRKRPPGVAHEVS